jgi:hypothetical protein
MMDSIDLEWLDEVLHDERFVLPKRISEQRSAAVLRLVAGGGDDQLERGQIRAYDSVMRMIEDMREEARRAREEEKSG